MVGDARVIPNTDSALAFMKVRGWSPKITAVIDRPLGIILPTTPLVDSTVVVQRIPDKVIVRTTVNRAGLLVLGDVYAHGWKAWVDDKPTTIVIANVAFRGVPVSAGTHTIRFEFDPDALRTGRTISLVLFMILLVYGAWFALTIVRRSSTETVET
jgi:hypothetical protein